MSGKLEIALRGHDESNSSLNKGNFREILLLISNYDPIVKRRLLNGPRNAQYTSPEIQNEILNIMGNMVRDQLLHLSKRQNIS